MRRLLFAGVAILAFITVSCTNAEEKMDTIERTGYVIWFDKKYKVKKVDRPNQAVFIIEPDGVAIAVALEMVKPAEGP
ncbi:MAG: hypothetical protein EPO63_08175 [Candidatus Nitrosotenuis sp.]|nr:MAG: hypothetical protein EPO63_08175 [Candidatus Nitrosotenuis sp.]